MCSGQSFTLPSPPPRQVRYETDSGILRKYLIVLFPAISTRDIAENQKFAETPQVAVMSSNLIEHTIFQELKNSRTQELKKKDWG